VKNKLDYFLIVIINLFFCLLEKPLLAQNNINNIPRQNSPNNLPRTIPRDNPNQNLPQPKIPRNLPNSSPLESTPEKPEVEQNLGDILVKVSEITITGYTVFSAKDLEDLIVVLDSKKIKIGAIKKQELSYNQLIQIAQTVTDFYNKNGYVTSGAIAQIPSEIKTNPNAEVIVTIQVIEGVLEQINVSHKDSEKQGRLDNYIRRRLGVETDKLLNVNNLFESLQLLQIDPLIKSLNAQLSTGSNNNKSVLIVDYIPANSFNPKISLDNSRPPSIGTFQREIEIRENNLTGLGDSISIDYRNTDGSNRIDGSYTVPITPDNASIGVLYTWSDSEVIQDPFYDIDLDGNGPDIESNYNAFDVTFTQPIIRNINNQTYQEFNLSLTTSWRETKSYLLDTGFPLSPGANESGSTRVFALRFAQEYSQQNPNDVLAFRSEFNLGIDAFNSTINEQIIGVQDIPDSTFFAWRGQAQYVKLFAPDQLFLARSNIQLSSEGLLPIEQFSIGGFGSVRGYRQDLILTDNGWVASMEFRYPILRVFEGDAVLQIIPFFDYGIGWNTSNIPNPNPQDLASVGVGLQFRYKNNLSAKIEYGIPLISVDINETTWQENGIYFSIQYFPFAD